MTIPIPTWAETKKYILDLNQHLVKCGNLYRYIFICKSIDKRPNFRPMLFYKWGKIIYMYIDLNMYLYICWKIFYNIIKPDFSMQLWNMWFCLSHCGIQVTKYNFFLKRFKNGIFCKKKRIMIDKKIGAIAQVIKYRLWNFY